MSSLIEEPKAQTIPASDGVASLPTRWPLLLALSALVLIPCYWHKHVEAGDLGSHVYNAWLAQLITEGKAPGLYIAHQWDNVLCDIGFLYLGKAFGFTAAEKIVVSICVLTFFWGVFAFIAAASDRPPWFLTPAIAMLAYGYAFNMGFLNYYLSLGLACVGLAIGWRSGPRNWLLVLLIAALTCLAHPLGFLWLLAMFVCRAIHRALPGLWKLLPFVFAVAVFYSVHWYLAEKAEFGVDWTGLPWYWRNGADQLAVYGPRYKFVSYAVFAFATLCAAIQGTQTFAGKRSKASPVEASEKNHRESRERRTRAEWPRWVLLLECYVIVIFATGWLPENLRPNPHAGWIGLLVSRLTVITAIFGLGLLGFLRPRRWHAWGFAAAALIFFSFLYQDTRWAGVMENNAERLLSTLPYGTRVVANVDAPGDWRVLFIGHSADRACIGHCFLYSNYEPASRQFRIRVSPMGSPIATDSTDDAENMQAGEYVVRPTDPPLVLLYQCDDHDLWRLCLHRLKPGEKTEEPDEPEASSQ
jgi:hypothetical protein